MDRRMERVIVETARYRVDGEVMLPPEGYKSRLSDHLNEPEREFLIVLDAELTAFDGSVEPFRVPVLMVHRARVDVIYPTA